MKRLFVAKLKRRNIITHHHGFAKFGWVRGSDFVKYVIKLKDIADIRKVDLHLRSNGSVGRRIATLYGPTQTGISVRKAFIKDHVRSSNLVNGVTIHELKKAIIEGRVFVVVHTDEFPSGQIHGLLKPVRKKRKHRRHHHGED